MGSTRFAMTTRASLLGAARRIAIEPRAERLARSDQRMGTPNGDTERSVRGFSVAVSRSFCRELAVAPSHLTPSTINRSGSETIRLF